MSFLERRYSTTHTIVGYYKEYDFKNDTYKDAVEFKYKEISGFEEIVDQIYGDLDVNISGLKISTLANLPFKAKDVIEDKERREFKIESVFIKQYDNPFIMSKPGRSKWQEKELTLE